jgi:hypothetical protein
MVVYDFDGYAHTISLPGQQVVGVLVENQVTAQLVQTIAVDLSMD